MTACRVVMYKRNNPWVKMDAEAYSLEGGVTVHSQRAYLLYTVVVDGVTHNILFHDGKPLGQVDPEDFVEVDFDELYGYY